MGCRGDSILTTGEAAKLCGVSVRTLRRWMDAGLLKFYKVPMSQDRRIQRDVLLKFMGEHPLPDSSRGGAGRGESRGFQQGENTMD